MGVLVDTDAPQTGNSEAAEVIMLTTPRIAGLLLVVNSVVLVTGIISARTGGMARLFWLPSMWIRVGIPLAVAGGLWYGQQWAWWTAVAMCVGLVLWAGISTLVLALGGYFVGQGATLRILHFSLLVGTWLAALVLLVSASGRVIGT